MRRHKLTDAEIKADIMNRLLRRNCWGAKYFPIDTLVNWLAKKIKRNGRRVKDYIEDLVREGYVLFHNRGEVLIIANSSFTRATGRGGLTALFQFSL
ncbi:MAG: hypothetical protein QXR59_02575 [Candidatus Bathyarchaeia archaeon]